jgi:hypothetical protein
MKMSSIHLLSVPVHKKSRRHERKPSETETAMVLRLRKSRK